MILRERAIRRWAVSILLVLLWAVPAQMAAADEAVLGVIDTGLFATGKSTARSGESALADMVADALKSELDADVAIVNGGDLRADLPRGAVTRGKLEGLFIADRPVATAVVSPAQLYAMLEAGVSHIVLAEDERIDHERSDVYGGFPQVSGIRYRYDASAPVGQRVMEVYLEDGTALLPDDESTRLTLAATAFMFSGGYDYPVVNSAEHARTLVDILAAYVQVEGTVTQPADGRIRAAGTTEGGLIDNVPMAGVLVAVVLLALLGDKKYKKQFSYRRV